MGAENGDLDVSIAAIVRVASKHLKILPSMINFPKNTSSGNFASCRPRTVRSSAAVRALTSMSAPIARRTVLEEGGSRASANVSSMPPSSKILTRSIKSCNDSRSISGVCSSAI